MREKDIARFWRKVDKNGPIPAHRPELGPCWLWMAAKDSSGYGRIWFDNALKGAHRVAWEIANGPIPISAGYHGACVLHACDRGDCVNQSHLFIGTQAENIADTVAKGRTAKGDATGPRRHPERMRRGESHGMAKLTELDVLKIRKRLASGETQASIAADFDVHRVTIGLIKRGKGWKHI